MDIPSLFMIPSAVSSGKVHSVFPNSTDADFDFNRDSDATRVNSEGLIERVGYYGSEKIVNGDFSSASGWSTSNASISNGVATLTGVPSQESNITRSDANGANGKTYKLTYTIISNNLIGTGALYAGLITSNEIIFKTNIPMTVGTHTVVGNSAGTGANFSLHISSGFTGGELVLDNISVKEITGDRARLNYEIEGGLVNTKPSLLLEPQSTNLITYSEDFSQWSVAGTITRTYNYRISPDGTINSTRVVFSGANEQIYIDFTSTSGVTGSIYIKGESGKTIKFGLSGAESLLTLNGEWQRITKYISGSTSRITLNTYSGATARDIEVFGGQAEALSYATSYIPTNGSTQTRAAETCNGAGTSSILPSEEGILYAEIEALANDGVNRVITIVNSSSTLNRIRLYYTTVDNRVIAEVRNSSGGFLMIYNGLSDVTTFNKFAVKYKNNNAALWVNGAEVLTDTTGGVPTGLNKLVFDDGSGSDDFYGKTRDIRVYNTKEMTDSEVDILLTKITS